MPAGGHHGADTSDAAEYAALPDTEATLQPLAPPPVTPPALKPRAAAVSIILAAVILAAPLRFPATPERHGAALFVLAAALWASDAVPPFVVGLAIPVLATALQLPPGLSPKERGAYNLASMSDPVVYLLLSSFALGAALHKHSVDARLAVALLHPASAVGPRTLIAVVLCVSTALSAVVGNACAAVAVLLLVTPLVRACPRASRFPQCCVSAVALGANIGGMITPVSSAQNAVALGDAVLGRLGCSVNFAEWVAATAPLCIAYLFAAHVLLFRYWRPSLEQLPAMPEREGCRGPLSASARGVAAISIATVAGWALFAPMASVFGDVGVLSLCPVVALWATGLMVKADFQALDWTVVMLLGGGSSLGRSAAASGLLDHCATALQQVLASWTPAAASAVYSLVTLLAANFVSHTVAAITLLPLVAHAAARSHVAATVMSAVMCDTCACALPVSSLPNMVAFASVDDDGLPYLTPGDLLKMGVAFEAVVFALTSTLGFALSSWVLRDACAVDAVVLS